MNRWKGWAAFGAILMMVVGIFHILSGIFGLFNEQWIVLDYSGFSVVDVTGLAVWYIAIGAVLLLGGIAVVQGSRLGRVVGMIAASLAIVSQLLILRIHPIWSIVLIVLYVMALIAFVRVKSPLEPDYPDEVLVMGEEPAAPSHPPCRSQQLPRPAAWRPAAVVDRRRPAPWSLPRYVASTCPGRSRRRDSRGRCGCSGADCRRPAQRARRRGSRAHR